MSSHARWLRRASASEKRPQRHQVYGGAALAAFLAISLWAGSARAGNQDAFYLSSGAALLGGAVTATSEGGGAIWYNPAGLAAIQGARSDVSVSGYALKFGGSPELAGGANATVQNLSRLDINVVPTALSYTMKIGGVGVGFGIFVPSQSTTIMRTSVRERFGSNGLDFAVDIYQRSQSYHAGPSFGFSPSKTLDFGASLLVTYQTNLDMGSVALKANTPDLNMAIATHQLSDGIQLGAEFVLGLKWKPLKDWRFGATVLTPAIRLAQILQTIDTTTQGAAGIEPESKITYRDDFGLAASVITPARFHLGAAHHRGDYLFSLDGSVLLPFIDTSFDVRGRATWNARLGAKRELSKTLAVGGGIFTDLSTSETPKEFGDTQINFYGITLAADFRTPVFIAGRGDELYGKPKQMLFGTSVALSYALGAGTTMGSRATYSSTTGLDIVDQTSSVVAHELTLHVASTVTE